MASSEVCHHHPFIVGVESGREKGCKLILPAYMTFTFNKTLLPLPIGMTIILEPKPNILPY